MPKEESNGFCQKSSWQAMVEFSHGELAFFLLAIKVLSSVADLLKLYVLVLVNKVDQQAVKNLTNIIFE